MLKRTAKPENSQPAAKRKLTRAERKQIEAIIRQAKGDGKPHTVQDSIPFRNLYPDGLCRLDDRLFSKTIAYEDVNYRLAGRTTSGISLNASAISITAMIPPSACK